MSADPRDPAEPGVFEARYLAFLETISHLRPSLHRYCSRMTGSVLDGEDVVQDALFLAYRKLDTFDDSRPLAPWLFRIAHNRCIDFLRQREARQAAEVEAAVPDSVAPADAHGPALARALEHLVLTLPPKERACVLLKDIFDYSLEEIAELVDSTVGGVKAALSRGRTKLAALPRDAASAPRAALRAATDAGAGAHIAAEGEMRSLLQLYVDRFNRRDWDALRELIADDARIRVTDRFAGRLDESPYFGRYDRWSLHWRLAVADIDGEPAIVVLMQREPHADCVDAPGADAPGVDGADWTPQSIVRLEVRDRRIHRIADYLHCPWVLAAVRSLVIEQAP